MNNRILLVSHDRILRITRGAILARAGYIVTPVDDAGAALRILKTFEFDLILVGRDSLSPTRPVDQQIRERYPNALILKVDDIASSEHAHSTQVTDQSPENLLASLERMLATVPTCGPGPG